VLHTGLIARGHAITLCTHKTHEALVASFAVAGLDSVGFGGDPEGLMRTERTQRLLERQDFTGLMMAIQDLTEAAYTDNATTCHAVGEGPGGPPDVVVANLSTWLFALPLAEGWGVPILIASFIPPGFPAPDLPPIMLCPRPTPITWLNLALGYLLRRLIVSLLGTSLTFHARPAD
jgi:hypothetical protein